MYHALSCVWCVCVLCVPCRLTGLCPGGWVSCGRSAPALGPADCAPRWSWPRCWPTSEPSEHTHTQKRKSLIAQAGVGKHSVLPVTFCHCYDDHYFVIRHNKGRERNNADSIHCGAAGWIFQPMLVYHCQIVHSA